MGLPIIKKRKKEKRGTQWVFNPRPHPPSHYYERGKSQLSCSSLVFDFMYQEKTKVLVGMKICANFSSQHKNFVSGIVQMFTRGTSIMMLIGDLQIAIK